MNNSTGRHLEPEQIALQRLQDAVHTYMHTLSVPFNTEKKRTTDDVITELEIAKLNFRNQLLAIESDLTTALIDTISCDEEINRIKKENLLKGV
jgi:hypothetical protein